ncbi:hypothetical protein [uncultured Deinococcus sp.]|uniref:hypothetical protein n=1 Tax=uncultured Deinococcus sp. TaxID=158789 RepID=UPI0025DCB493|nr:hypothetical protein [uncultured Deinococcus sp.]
MPAELRTRSSPEHTVYLLRVWYESGDAVPVWRASLHSSDGTPRRYFAVPGRLLDYLGHVLDPNAADGPPPAS